MTKFNLFLLKLLLVILPSSIASSQNCTDVKELFRKRHIISEMTYGHPYTTFDRHNANYKNLDNAIDNIRKNISDEKSKKGPIYIAYQKIYNKAVESMPSDNGMESDKSMSNLALWAKNNAFVNLIGLDSIARLLDKTDTTGTKRNSFKFKAIASFQRISGEIKSDNSYMQGYSRSLIQWLQCYDLLKATAASIEFPTSRAYFQDKDSDRNKDECSPRNILRKLTRNIYRESTGLNGTMTSRTGWKKNHGIAAASCLLMAAQVLNDAGVETSFFVGIWGSIWSAIGGDADVVYAPNYSPSPLASVPLVSLLISLWLVLSKLAVSLTFLLSEKFWFLGTQTKDKNHTALVNQIFT